VGQLIEGRGVEYDVVLLLDITFDGGVDELTDTGSRDGAGRKHEQLHLVLQVVVPGVLGVSVDVDVEERDDEHQHQDDDDDLLDRHLGKDLADLRFLAEGGF
jgi:hypothetical protein